MSSPAKSEAPQALPVVGGDRSRARIFWTEMGYLALLIALAVTFLTVPALKAAFQGSIGVVPIGIPWFGAVGGVTISLTGVFRHRADWLPDYVFWHIARPLVSAITGTVGYLIYTAGLAALTQQAQTGTNKGALISGYVVAFAIGYREEAFRDLLGRFVDKLLGRPSQPAPANGPRTQSGSESSERTE